MPVGSIAFLVDTNVLVYAYDPADGDRRRRAIEVLEHLGNEQTGALSAQILGEFFAVTTRPTRPILSVAEAVERLTNYIRSWPVFDVTPAAVLEAARGSIEHQMAYWDALVWATAKTNGVPDILTEDLPGNPVLEGIRFHDPFAAEFDLAQLTR